MQAPTRGSIREGRIRPPLRLELPDELQAHVDEALGQLFDLTPALAGPESQPRVVRSCEPEALRVAAGAEGWCIEGKDVDERALMEDAALLRLQGLLLESAVRRDHQILFRGSVVSRGSQSVLIV